MLTNLFDQFAVYVLASASTIMLLALGWKFRKIAASGNVIKMLMTTFALPLMVGGAVLASVIVARIARPLLDQNLVGQPVVGGLSAARSFVSAIDSGIAWANTPYQGTPANNGGNSDYMTQMYAAQVVGNDDAVVSAASMGDVAQLGGIIGALEPAPATATPAPVVITASYSAGANNERYHVVAPGDSLSRIANFYYHDKGMWDEICAANRDQITDCSNIKVGWRLRLPAVSEQQFTQLVDSGSPDGGNEPPSQDGPFAADGRVYYETKALDYVPAAIAVTCQGCDPVKSYVEAANAQPVLPTPVIQSAAASQGRVVYDVPTPAFEISVNGGNGAGEVIVQPTPRPQPTATRATIQVALDYAAPRVDTSVGGIGASNSASGTTVTVGN